MCECGVFASGVTPDASGVSPDLDVTQTAGEAERDVLVPIGQPRHLGPEEDEAVEVQLAVGAGRLAARHVLAVNDHF